jgi:hypothetical protein
MILLGLVTLLAARSVALTREAKPKVVELLLPGEHLQEDVPKYPSDGWIALIETKSGAIIKKVRPQITAITVRDHYPGLKVSADGDTNAVFLLRGLTRVQEGSVPTWHDGSWRVSPEGTVPLSGAGAERYEVFTSAPIPWKGEEENGVDLVYELRARERSTGREQVLGVWIVGSYPSIRWIGDVDQDGQLDLFLDDQTPETGEASWTVFLSSLANMSQIVGPSVVIHRTGC